ncbi:MAG TPA: PilZ domain-containing protein [Ruminiclostridium sp.]|nr:PilZ domain-containing protein [Ruminiclostridium sp.]
MMRNRNRLCRIGLAAFELITILVWTSTALAADRNDALFSLKDTLNSSDKNGASGLFILIILGVLIIWLVYYMSSREKKDQINTLNTHREKARSQTSSQKRNWFRFQTNAEFKWIPAEQAERVKEKNYHTSQMIDISGGGLSFKTTEPVRPGDELHIQLPIDGGKPFPVDALVIRVAEEEDGNKISVEFLGLRDGHRDRIVSWIQRTQRNI